MEITAKIAGSRIWPMAKIESLDKIKATESYIENRPALLGIRIVIRDSDLQLRPQFFFIEAAWNWLCIKNEENSYNAHNSHNSHIVRQKSISILCFKLFCMQWPIDGISVCCLTFLRTHLYRSSRCADVHFANKFWLIQK